MCECPGNRKKVLQEEEIRERVFDKEKRERERARGRGVAGRGIWRAITSGRSFPVGHLFEDTGAEFSYSSVSSEGEGLPGAFSREAEFLL